MTAQFEEDEEIDELLLDDDINLDLDDDIILDDALLDGVIPEITLDDVELLEEDENIGHKVQTYDTEGDGTDNYFDERYFDE
jgi:hypothetical protein